MSLALLLEKVAGTYERKARLYPAFLALTPLLGIAVGIYGMSIDAKEALIALAADMGVFYLLANIVRESGNRIEEKLFRLWGGTPTTQLQRHRDGRIDSITKHARHEFLGTKLKVPFPDEATELADPARADEIYSAGTRWLIEHTRDRTRFPLLFNENVAYGYRRNALGLKPIAVAICVVSIAWVLVSQGAIAPSGVCILALAHMTGRASLSLAFSVTMLFVWLLFFTERAVKTAAFAYADMLLRTCALLDEQNR